VVAMPFVEAPMSGFATEIMESKKYTHQINGRRETWDEAAGRVAYNVVSPYLPDLTARVQARIARKQTMPGGRYLYAAGRKYHQINNCFLFRAQDTKEGWGDLLNKAAVSLMTGGGIGVDYTPIRAEGEVVVGLGGECTGPCSLGGIVNEAGRRIMQGGSRRSAIWAGLLWSHKDVFKFIHLKDWSEDIKELKRKDFNFPAEMDMTNISVILDTEFFAAYHDEAHPRHRHAHKVYWECINSMLRTGEPGFSVDTGDNEGDNLRNACTEVSSAEDSDMCNLASLNMARFDTLEDFVQAVDETVGLLICGTLYSKLPTEQMYKVREKNRRLGLGLMGIHEWLLRRGYRYGPCDELGQWMSAYALSGAFANRWADKLSISRPVATRAIAPTGTISIVAETTGGIEPITTVAYKRRYLDGKVWKAQYKVDSTAKRLVDQGVDPDAIEDAYSLAEDVERRIGFQAWVQKFVDHSISSTINLPTWGSSVNNETTVKPFGQTLLKYLPDLRGMTAYPDGARAGQPITKVPYSEAICQEGVVFFDGGEYCKGGVCGA
jgi:ribonucleoside-diphosphate reductase alpha chain